MKTTSIFRGAATALVTPLTASGVDYDAFGRLIDWQIESGINALVIAGTTGEGSTLSDEEHREVMRYAAQRNAGRVPMIAGILTGSLGTLLMGIIMADAAGGDILIVWQILRYRSEAGSVVYIDHPTQAGGVIFEK